MLYHNLLEGIRQHSVFSGYEDFGSKVSGIIWAAWGQKLLEEFGQHSVFTGYDNFWGRSYWKNLGGILCLIDVTILDQKLLEEFELCLVDLTPLDQKFLDEVGQHSVFSGYEDLGSNVNGRI